MKEKVRRRYIGFTITKEGLARSYMVNLINAIPLQRSTGVWLTVFGDKKGIVRVNHDKVDRCMEVLSRLPKELGLKTIVTSGTIKTVRERMNIKRTPRRGKNRV